MEGKIIKQISNLYTVNSNDINYDCHARGKFRHSKLTPLVGDIVEFGGLLGSGPVMSVNSKSSVEFINRGGRIPAPIHSLKN